MSTGRYYLDVDFGRLSEQKDLLRSLVKALGTNKHLLNGLIKLLEDIERQEATTDTSVKERVVKSSYVSAAQLALEEQSLKQQPVFQKV